MSDDVSPLEESERVQSQDVAPDGSGAVPMHRGRFTSGGAWVGGAFLIVLGIIFLLQNVGLKVPFLQNWWALFILFPAVDSLARAWRAYRSSGQRLTRHGSGSLIGGLAMLLVATTLLFGWSWSLIWPIFLILAGLGALVGGLVSR